MLNRSRYFEVVPPRSSSVEKNRGHKPRGTGLLWMSEYYDMRQDGGVDYVPECDPILDEEVQETVDDPSAHAGPAPSGQDIAVAVGHYAEEPVRAPVKDGVGYSPTNTDGSAAGPYIHAYENGDSVGGGLGLMDGSVGPGTNASILSANGRVGAWKDERGGTVSGGEVNAQAMKLTVAPGGELGPMGFDIGALDANATATIGENEASIGAGANVADAALTLGSQDNNVRAGVSCGVGLAGRAHYSLNPETHKRSYGLGADFGAFSLDARTDYFSDEALAPTEAVPTKEDEQSYTIMPSYHVP